MLVPYSYCEPYAMNKHQQDSEFNMCSKQYILQTYTKFTSGSGYFCGLTYLFGIPLPMLSLETPTEPNCPNSAVALSLFL